MSVMAATALTVVAMTVSAVASAMSVVMLTVTAAVSMSAALMAAVLIMVVTATSATATTASAAASFAAQTAHHALYLTVGSLPALHNLALEVELHACERVVEIHCHLVVGNLEDMSEEPVAVLVL